MCITIRVATRLLMVLMSVVWIACSDAPVPPPNFAAAYETLDRALSPEVLNRTGFASRFPKPTAQQTVSFLFSQAGVQALQADVSPLGEEVDPLENIPIWPRDVVLRHSTRTEVSARQVVLTWDDVKGVVVGEAFDYDPAIVFRKEWKIPSLKAERPADPTDKRPYQAF